ncbi:MAG: phage Gp37/Gp68 family protein [Ferrovibrio sp.]|nr:phage Gp37/Gp68 family protein [Ferrovibrio sp.]
MAANSSIEWTDATWNPVRGCTRVSEGCRNCYAEIMAARFSKPGQWGHGIATMVKLPDGKTDHRWTGAIAWADSQVMLPLQWTRPRRIFVNSTSDLFHDQVKEEWLDHIFAVMMLSPQHTFQILTKRPDRMAMYMTAPRRSANIARAVVDMAIADPSLLKRDPWPVASIGDIDLPDDIEMAYWPLPNVWLGTSVEDQASFNDRYPHLLETPAAVRFISAEPLLGPITLDNLPVPRPDWVICGGESGPGARPMHPDWARSLRDQCAAANVPFFFKQWGEWAPEVGAVDGWSIDDDPETSRFPHRDWEGDHFGTPYTRQWMDDVDDDTVSRIGKKAAGRLLDGREHSDFPAVR